MGSALGRYQLRRLLGQGSMGAVYLGFDPLIEREVAIKVLPKTLADNDTSLKRFLAEAKAVGKLNHANVILVFDIDQQDGRHFIVMELAHGGSVNERLQAEQRMPLEEACRIVSQAAEGLNAAHAAGLIHRDINDAVPTTRISAHKPISLWGSNWMARSALSRLRRSRRLSFL